MSELYIANMLPVKHHSFNLLEQKSDIWAYRFLTDAEYHNALWSFQQD